MSETPREPATASRAERTLMRLLATLAAVMWPGGLAAVTARAAHALPLAENTYCVLASWLIALGCLGLGVAVIRNEDPRVVRALSLLDFGNPKLDAVLPDVPPRPWRARAGTRLLFTAVGAACWVVAILYSVQIALGVYRVGPIAELFVLIWFLALAIWSTVIVACSPAEARRACAFELACGAHQEQRRQRDLLQQAAHDATSGDTGEFTRPVFGVIDGDARTPAPRREGHHSASG